MKFFTAVVCIILGILFIIVGGRLFEWTPGYWIGGLFIISGFVGSFDKERSKSYRPKKHKYIPKSLEERRRDWRIEMAGMSTFGIESNMDRFLQRKFTFMEDMSRAERALDDIDHSGRASDPLFAKKTRKEVAEYYNTSKELYDEVLMYIDESSLELERRENLHR